MMEQPWWKGDLAADVHQTLRLKVRLDRWDIWMKALKSLSMGK
uniref:Uncharacterized protein n=1 Tax=Laticauda laticaudata TaxID=8630 RepID=A0A8C5SM32_LATLA